MEFNLYSDRSLTPTNRNRGVENENKSQLLCIYIQDKTLLDKKAFIEFKTDSEERYITERLTISEDGAIVYQLLNGLMQTEYLQFQVIFTDDYNWVWKSVVKEILIQNSINTADQLAKEYPDFISNAQEVLSQVEEVAETVVEKVDEIEETVNEYTQRVEQVEQTVEEYTQAEESRVQAENLRVANETQRIANENGRVSNEQTRASNETTRQTQETTRQGNEQTRQANEETRKQNEISRQNAETIRENTFTTNEANRQSTFQTNEATRQSTFESNEQIREQNETTRKSNELARQSAESTRASQESTRQTQEASRVSAESLRVSAETTRASNESTRQSNESTRQTNESTRVSQETTREQNESTRIANEESRVQAETNRASEFATWEDEIDSKADKDYVDKKDNNLQYEIADLKAKLYETVVGVKQLKTEYASEIDIPTHITEDSVAYPVLDNTAMEAATIKGHTLKWNQLLQNPDFISSGANWSAYYYGGSTSWSDGILTVRKSDGTCDISQPLSQTIPSGHKVIFISKLKTTNNNNVGFGGTSFSGTSFATTTSFNSYYYIHSLTSDLARIYIACYGTEDVEMSVDYVYLIDLTQMFGSGNEPTSVDDSRVQWAIAYATKHPEYDAGSLKNVNVEKIISANTSEIGNLPLKKINVVDLGTLNWIEYDPGTKIWVATNNHNFKPLNNANTPLLNGACSKYVIINRDSIEETLDKTINLGHNYYQIAIKDTSYANATAFKQTMSGVILYYEVAEELQEINAQVYERFGLGTLTLPNIDLRGVNDIQDTLAFVEQENGTYNLEHTKYVGRVDLGTLNWNQVTYGNVNGYYSERYLDAKPSGLCLATNYSYEANDTTFNTNNINNEITINALNNIKVKSSNTPTGYLDYEKARPVKTTIATGLLFDEVSLLINKYGRIEVVNRSSDNVNADTTFNVAVKEFKDNE